MGNMYHHGWMLPFLLPGSLTQLRAIRRRLRKGHAAEREQ